MPALDIVSSSDTKSTVEAAMKRLSAIEQRQMPFAISLAINNTAFRLLPAMQKEMVRAFDRPTPFILRSLRIERGTVRAPAAKLRFKDKFASGADPEKTIREQVKGGVRPQKRFEERLQSKGLLPLGWVTVPGGGAKLDQYGNVSRVSINQALRGVGATHKARSARAARTSQFFVGTIHGTRGIWQRVQSAFGRGVRPIFLFVPRAKYSRRLDFYGVSQRTTREWFPFDLDAAVKRALRTAR